MSAPIVGFLSGKGGVGKTNVATNVAVAARSLGQRVLLVDGDLGLANVDVLLGLVPTHTLGELLDGDCALADVLLEGPRGVHVLPAASARSDLTARRPAELAAMLVPLFTSASGYDLVVVDIAAGIAPTAVTLAASCDRVVLVTNPEPTSLADAYATLKVMRNQAPEVVVELLVNEVDGELEAHDTHRRLELLTQRFLGTSPALLGHLPRDRRVGRAVKEQRAVVEAYPTARASRSLVRLTERILRGPIRRADSELAAPACASGG